MANDRTIVYISEEHDSITKEWAKDNSFYNFRDAENKEIFLLAASKGYRLYYPNMKPSFRRSSGGYFRESYLNKNDYATIYALYMDKIGKIEDLVNKEVILSFAEIAAYNGFKVLMDEMGNSAKENFEKRKIATELDKQYEQIGQKHDKAACE